MPTKTRAAIIRSAPGNYEVVDVELDDPRQGELLVKMVATGFCHSDDHLRTGDIPPLHLPIIGGHEGAGIVQEVGPNTSGWEVGDHVVFMFVPSCGRCRPCNEGMTNLCDLGANTLLGSRIDDLESFRVMLEDGTEVGQLCGLGTFAEHTVVSVDSAIKVDKDLPLEVVCLLGCGVGTGWGSAVYAAETKPGDDVIIMGIGGIGINAVQGAKHAGAKTIVAVDPIEFKREQALAFGATHTFADITEAADFARSITNGQGADRAIVTVGVVRGEYVGQALSAIRKGGVVVMTGAAKADEASIPVNLNEMTFMQKRLQGAIFGSCNPRTDIPRQIGMYRAGQLKLDELVTRNYRLDDIAQIGDDMLEGKNIRGVVRFDA